MKRFLSLVLSALFVFQAGNASCDAASNWDARKVPVQQRGLFVSYIPQQQHIINVTAPEQPAPVVNVAPTPQNITVQSPVNIKKVDATTLGDKISGWVKCAFWVLLAGGVAFLGHWLWSLKLPSLRKMILSKSNEIFESVGGNVAKGLDFMLRTNGSIKASFDSKMDLAKNMMTLEELKEFEKETGHGMWKGGKTGKQEENKSWWCEHVGWFCS